MIVNFPKWVCTLCGVMHVTTCPRAIAVVPEETPSEAAQEPVVDPLDALLHQIANSQATSSTENKKSTVDEKHPPVVDGEI